MKKKILFPILIIFLLINSCGFKIINKSEIYKFDINEIIATGDNRINFRIKNKLIFRSEQNGKKLVDIYLDTNKTKEVKAYVTPIKLKDYYLTIPFRKEYIASILPEESSNIISKIDKDLHITVKYDLTMSDLINLLGKKRNIQIFI